MNHKQIISNHLNEHREVISEMQNSLSSEIAQHAKKSHALSNGATVFWCGNGGSAADGQHLAAELVGRFENNVVLYVPLR